MSGEQYYREAAAHALAGFQLIEESLKTYIGAYHETVRQFLPEKLVYRYSRKDIQDAALGKLVGVFAKISANETLVAELRTLSKTRDDLAHKAFVHLYGPAPSDDELKKRAVGFVKTAERLGEILGELRADSLKLMTIRHLSAGSGQEQLVRDGEVPFIR